MASLNQLTRLSPSARGHAPDHRPWDMARVRRHLRLSIIFLAFLAASIVVTLVLVVFELHPTVSHVVELLLYLAGIGVGSFIVSQIALWLVGTSRFGGIRVKLALLPVLTAGVIALDVLLLARLMFITVEDGRLLLLFLVFATLVALGISFSLGSSLSARIAHIEQGARRLASGEYAVRLTDEGADGEDEITHLAGWFNQMAAAVQEAFRERQAAEEERRQVVAALSHDLRTPLTAVRALIEALDDGVVTDPDMVRRYQHTIRAEMRRLSGLMDDLFELSRMESGSLTLSRERMSLEDVLSDALEGAHTMADLAGIQLDGQVDAALPEAEVDVRQLHRVLINLLQNALRHTPPGGRVLLRAEPQDRKNECCVLVQVLDTGEGIAPLDMPHVFVPTYRSEASRRRADADATGFAGVGAGLGLAIARGIIEAHGGQIWATSPLSPEQRRLVTGGDHDTLLPGTALSFTLPAAR
ncbi:MAG: sensor histidine kinase [Ktedonobacterales bacterium]